MLYNIYYIIYIYVIAFFLFYYGCGYVPTSNNKGIYNKL